MIKEVNLEKLKVVLELENIELPKDVYFKPGIVNFKKTVADSKSTINYKRAINLKYSKYLESLIIDQGYALLDEENKGFCLSWKDIDKIKVVNRKKELEDLTTEDLDEEDKLIDKILSTFLEHIIEEIKKC